MACVYDVFVLVCGVCVCVCVCVCAFMRTQVCLEARREFGHGLDNFISYMLHISLSNIAYRYNTHIKGMTNHVTVELISAIAHVHDIYGATKLPPTCA